MNWNTSLLEQPLEQAPAEAECTLSALTSLGLIRVQGEDARTFLQGQLTCDTDGVTSEQARIGAWCTPKGRVLASMLIFQLGGNLYLQLPRERIEAVLKRLRMFVLRAKVTLADASDELGIMAVSGNCAADMVGEMPAERFGTKQDDGLTYIRFPGDPARIQVVGEGDLLIALWKKWAQKAVTANSDGWVLQNIRSGIPTVLEATTEAFIPQMLNLDLLDGISFTKGCYTGQEVVARMKYLGQLKRRMYLSRFETEATPQAGDKLFSPQSKSPQGAGKIVEVQPSPKGGWEALVVAEIETAETGDLHLDDSDGPLLNLQPPPYGLDTPE